MNTHGGAKKKPETNGHCLSHTSAPVTQQYNLVLAQGTIGSAAGKGIVSLEWQWQCVTDLSGLFTDGFKAWEGEQPTNTTHLIGYGTLYLNCMTTGS